MDISDSFDPQQPHPQQAQHPQQQQFIGPQPESLFPQSQSIPLPAPNGMVLDGEIQRPPVDFDIDSCLLQQFSCLGTTDHEDLINQFQIFMNNQVNKDTAKFFLEMSNWNLQTAVGCYFDFFNQSTQYVAVPSMKIIEQARPSDSRLSWKLQNDGTLDWPNGCYLMSPNQEKRISVPRIRPGETCDIMADIPPTSPAIMWRLFTPEGAPFGETIWMIPSGSPDTAADLAERMSQLRTSNLTTSTPTESFPQVNVVIMVNVNMD